MYGHGGPNATLEPGTEQSNYLLRFSEPWLFDQPYSFSGEAYLRDYYAFTGPFAEKIAEGMLSTPQAIAQFVRGYAEAGCEELVLLPAVAELEQVERLAEVLAAIG